MDIAYQVVGEGDIDLVLVPGWISHLEVTWELAESARFRGRLSEFARVVLFDKRGTGLSDRVPTPPTQEEHAQDVRAVLDAVGSARAAIAAWADGAGAAVAFARRFPERVSALVLGAVVAKLQSEEAQEEPEIDPTVLEEWAASIESSWGEGVFLPLLAPSMAGDPRFSAWWRRLERSAVTPNARRRILQVDAPGRPAAHAARCAGADPGDPPP